MGSKLWISCQLLPEAIVVSVRAQVKLSVMLAKVRVGELLLVKRVKDLANIVGFVMGAVE